MDLGNHSFHHHHRAVVRCREITDTLLPRDGEHLVEDKHVGGPAHGDLGHSPVAVHGPCHRHRLPGTEIGPGTGERCRVGRQGNIDLTAGVAQGQDAQPLVGSPVVADHAPHRHPLVEPVGGYLVDRYLNRLPGPELGVLWHVEDQVLELFFNS